MIIPIHVTMNDCREHFSEGTCWTSLAPHTADHHTEQDIVSNFYLGRRNVMQPSAIADIGDCHCGYCQ
jgi:hypothetical protein